MQGRVPQSFRVEIAEVDASDSAKRICRQWAIRFPVVRWDTPDMTARGTGLMLDKSFGDALTVRRLACATAWECWKRHYTDAYYIDIESLINLNKMTWDKDSGAEGDRDVAKRIIKNLINGELLVIDGMGREQANEWTRVELPSLIDRRHSRGKPTIVTTQLSVKALQAQYTGHMVFDYAFGGVVGATRTKG